MLGPQQTMYFLKKQILKHNIYFSPNVSKYGYGEDQLFFLKLEKLERELHGITIQFLKLLKETEVP